MKGYSPSEAGSHITHQLLFLDGFRFILKEYTSQNDKGVGNGNKTNNQEEAIAAF